MITSFPDLLKGLILGMIIGAAALFVLARFGLFNVATYVCP